MIKFLYGPDTYRIKEATKKLEADFIESQKSDLNVVKIDGEKMTLGRFESEIATMPFLGDKRLIIITNFLLDNSDNDLKKTISEKLKSVPDRIDLVFVEMGEPDKRTSLFKALDRKEIATRFDSLSDLELRQWITAKAGENDCTIANPAIYKLSLFVGPDLWRLQNEIIKLSLIALSKGEKEITADMIEENVEANNNFKIFDLTDAIAVKNSKKALEVLSAFEKEGDDAIRILSLIIYQIRTMLIVDDLKVLTADKIAKEAAIHPFVVKKTLSALAKFNSVRLKAIFRYLGEIDWQIKSGQIDPEVALDLLVVKLTR